MMDQVLNQLLTSATGHRDAAKGEGLKLFYEGMCQAYMNLHMIILANAVATEITSKKSLLDENKRLTNERDDAISKYNEATAFKDATTRPVEKSWIRPVAPEVANAQDTD